MKKRIIICIAVIISFVCLAIIANQYLEIYPRKDPVSPTNDVLTNVFYAMELWLTETGHPVRRETDFNPEEIASTHEKVALIYAGAYNWEEADEFLLPWIESGNTFVLFINSPYLYDENSSLKDFINNFGIEAELNPAFLNINSETDILSDDIPNFDNRISFLVDKEDADFFSIKDEQDLIRLIQISAGEGKIIITGIPYFMHNNYLKRETKKEANANLTWELTGAQTTEENPGVLFVRSQRSNYSRTSYSMFGKIMERGNLISVIIPALLVIIFGFWSVIPIFGLVFHEKQRNSRPITERFSAEILFLKKNNALNYYLETYERELQQENTTEKEKYKHKNEEIINKIRSVYDGTERFKRGNSRLKT
jgi:hypothetical protein